MSSRHLSCLGCRVRVLADAPEIHLLDGRCPICGVTLRAASSASGVVGFRSFDLDGLSEQASDDRPSGSAHHVAFVARRESVWTQDNEGADRWSDDGRAGVRVAARPQPLDALADTRRGGLLECRPLSSS